MEPSALNATEAVRWLPAVSLRELAEIVGSRLAPDGNRDTPQGVFLDTFQG